MTQFLTRSTHLKRRRRRAAAAVVAATLLTTAVAAGWISARLLGLPPTS